MDPYSSVEADARSPCVSDADFACFLAPVRGVRFGHTTVQLLLIGLGRRR